MVSPSTALAAHTYVPILKAKRAELDAIASVPSDALVPLFEFVDGGKARELLARAWAGRPGDVVWVQLLNVEGADDSSFAEALTDLFAELRSDFRAVPVVTTTEEPMTLAAVAAIAATDSRGVVLRVDAEELVDERIDSSRDMDATLRGLRVLRSEVDLVLDAGLLSGSATIQAAVAGQAARELDYVDWRSMVLAFSAFPQALGEVAERGAITPIPRSDAAAFVSTRRSTGLPLVFGDYTVGTPYYGSAPFTPIPNIRYASDAEWHIHRGTQRAEPAGQYRALAAAILGAPYYSGAHFSPGDQQISDVATGAGGPGNATTHLRAAVSRHVHLVLARLATLGAP